MSTPVPARSALTRADLRLVPTACALWTLAAVGAAQGVRPVLVALALLVVAALVPVLIAGRTDAVRAVCAHLALLLVGTLLLLPAVQRAQAARDVLEQAQADGRTVTLQARVLEEPEAREGGPEWASPSVMAPVVLPAGTVRVGREEHRLPVRLRALLVGDAGTAAAGEGPAELSLAGASMGDVVRIRGRPSVEGTLVMIRVTEVQRIDTARGIRAQLRAAARDTTGTLPADEAALVRGMTTGDTAGLSRAAEDAMQGAGLSHLVAVSGSNLGLVLGAVLVPLLLLGAPRRPRILLAVLVGAGYVALVGDHPSVLRAATMAAPMLAARFAGVRPSPVAALATALVLWSVAAPLEAASIGFVLSALATGAILVLAPPTARAIGSLSRERLSGPAALVVAVPLVAQAACTPVLILLVPEVSLWTVAANLLAAPLVGPATVLGLIAVVIGPLAPGLAGVLWLLPAGSAHLVLLIAHGAASLPGAHIAVPDGAAGALGAVAVLAAVAAMTALRHRRAVRWLAAVAAAVLIAQGAARCSPWLPGAAQGWTVAACAVGQGDATLLRTLPPGADPFVVLIDTGPDPAALTACLDDLRVERIDLLVLTHPHADHVGGNGALTGPRMPREQWVCPSRDAQGAAVPGPAARPVVRGDGADLPGLRLDVLWPLSAEDVVRVAARETSSSEQGDANDCSVVLAATWSDGSRFVGLGDLEPEAQASLAELGPGPTDLVKVAHHGSRRQDGALYAALSPSLALVEVGQDNTFGHPAPATLTMLDVLGTPAVRTDRDGTVVLTPRAAADSMQGSGDGSEGASPGAPGWDLADARSVGPPR